MGARRLQLRDAVDQPDRRNKRPINPVLAKRKFEMFDYPGRYQTRGPGETAAKLRIEYEEAAYQAITGEGACVGFDAGHVSSRWPTLKATMPAASTC